MTLRERQKEEAIKRMKTLGLMSNVIKDFEKNNKVYYSERQNAFFNAILYWIDNEPEFIKTVKQFEKKHNALVYHCQLTHLECGDVLSLLYVSTNENEWQQDKEQLTQGIAYAYVKNLKSDYDSEFGSIGVRPSMGGVLRTA